MAQLQERLVDLVSLLNSFPELNVALEGHADRRGAESDNYQLSSERIFTIKAELMAAGGVTSEPVVVDG